MSSVIRQLLDCSTRMADSPPRLPIAKRPDEELLEDLCIELRHVACGDGDLPRGERVAAHVREVCDIHAELDRRRVNHRHRLERLSEETQWQIPILLQDCLAFPQRVPWVRESDGIRRWLRCHLCLKAERHPDAKHFWFCVGCLQRVLDAMRQRTPFRGVLLFRTYNAENRCAHADADTVLACDGSYSEEAFGICEKCIHDELERRNVA